MSAVLGVDPTATGTGAAVLRVDGVVAAWWVWTRVAAGWRVRCSVPGHPADPGGLSSLDSVGAYVSGGAATTGGPDVRLVVEGLFAPPRWKKGASGAQVIGLAEATGRTIAGLARYCGEPVARPTWRDWAATIGCADGSADACERVTLGLAMREGWLPRGLTGAEQVAVSEAGVMARWVVG